MQFKGRLRKNEQYCEDNVNFRNDTIARGDAEQVGARKEFSKLLKGMDPERQQELVVSF